MFSSGIRQMLVLGRVPITVSHWVAKTQGEDHTNTSEKK